LGEVESWENPAETLGNADVDSELRLLVDRLGHQGLHEELLVEGKSLKITTWDLLDLTHK